MAGFITKGGTNLWFKLNNRLPGLKDFGGKIGKILFYSFDLYLNFIQKFYNIFKHLFKNKLSFFLQDMSI